MDFCFIWSMFDRRRMLCLCLVLSLIGIAPSHGWALLPYAGSRHSIMTTRKVDATTCCSSTQTLLGFQRHAKQQIIMGHKMSMDNDDDDEDEEYGEDVDVSQFKPPNMRQSGFGWNRGRSAPSQRKAMGKSSVGSTQVHVCTDCGSEFVKWFGKCPTCQEWNTLQPMSVGRASTQQKPKPMFGKSKSSWLDGIQNSNNSGNNPYGIYQPVRITDAYKECFETNKPQRLEIPGDEELTNVLGGGIMPGSITLIGGDPGVGKSTLLLQVAGSIAALSTPSRGIGMGMDENEKTSKNDIGPVLYVSGEENAMQIASRASRLGIITPQLMLLCECDADIICETVVASQYPAPPNAYDDDDDDNDDLLRQTFGQGKPPSLVVIDSIQTMVCESGGASSAGGVTQVRECVGLFLRLAKSTSIPILLVGHVTKSGTVAGPRTVEHMVDCVLYLESTENPNLRMLRAAKNRFGSADEVGVYEMSAASHGRLIPVTDPSSLFLATRVDTSDSEGCAISLVLEGIRPMTVEVQALVSQCMGPATFSGRRTVNGISAARLLLLLAVLQKRFGISFHRQDVYVNVAGGIQLGTTQRKGDNTGSGSDLAVAIALVSSLMDIPVRSDTAFVGEVGLLGELRPVPSIDKRVQEARRMGFSRIITPNRYNNNKRRQTNNRSRNNSPRTSSGGGIDWIECDNLLSAINAGLIRPLEQKKRRTSRTKTTNVQGGNQQQGVRITGSTPGSINDLNLDTDDEEDDTITFNDVDELPFE